MVTVRALTKPLKHHFLGYYGINRKTILGKFNSPEPFRGDIRYDLHPR